MSRSRARSRARQRGSAMLVTLVLIASLLAGASVLVSMQLSSNRSTDLTRSGLTALYCAEAGLAAARPTVQAQYAQWAATLTADPTGTGPQPTWLDDTAFSHDLDGDGIDDFHINIRDNDDEIAPAGNVPTNDIDGRVYVISTCDKFPDNPRQVMELAKFTAGGGACYNGAGGCDGNGNSN